MFGGRGSAAAIKPEFPVVRGTSVLTMFCYFSVSLALFNLIGHPHERELLGDNVGGGFRHA